MKFRSCLVLVALTTFAATGAIFAEEPAPSPTESAAESPKADFGDYSSKDLTSKAWKASESNNLEEVKTYTQKCIDMFGAKALEMQAAIQGPIDTSNKEKVFANWALNDVGTCYFILGQALEKSGDKKGAIEAYKNVSEKLPDAECWDPKGWFWKPADAAKGKIKALEFDAIS